MRPQSLGFDHARINFGMFDFGFNCIIGPAKNVPKYIALKLEEPKAALDDPPTMRGGFYYRRGFYPIVWLPRWPKTPAKFGTLTHEVTHVVVAMFDWAGMPIDYKSDEAFCHAIGFGVRKVLEAKPR